MAAQRESESEAMTDISLQKTAKTARRGTAVGRSAITPGEGFAMSQMIEIFLRAIDASDFESRSRELEKMVRGKPPKSKGLRSQ